MMETRRQPASAFTRMQLGLILLGMREAGIKDPAELARALDLEAQTVYKWFTQERGASLDVRERLAVLLAIPLDDLRATTQLRNRASSEGASQDMRALVREELARMLGIEAPPDGTKDNSQTTEKAAAFALLDEVVTRNTQHSASVGRPQSGEGLVPLPAAAALQPAWGVVTG